LCFQRGYPATYFRILTEYYLYGRDHFEDSGCRLEGNIKMVLKEIGCEGGTGFVQIEIKTGGGLL
jgi:hypothetical protein